MLRAPDEGRLFRVSYGEGELEFMLQPWFHLTEGRPSPDIVVVGVGGPAGADLGRALRAASGAGALARAGGAVVMAARLEDGKGDAEPDAAAAPVIVAASEAPEIVRLLGLRPAVDVEEALDIAYEHIGRPERAWVLVVPRASSTPPS